MTPIQQLMLGVSAGKTTYLDDVFSNYLYLGNQTARSFNNGINLSESGGMVWIKHRDGTYDHNLFDTERGVGKYIESNTNAAEGTSSPRLNAFNNNGFSIGANAAVNATGNSFASWSFRKSPMFDVVTWDGNGTAGRVISHSLGSVPGLIMIKSTTDATAWFTYHRDLGAEKYLILNETNAVADQTWFMNDTAPTSTGFSVGGSNNVNGSGRSYVAYLFAGGESTAATATSCNFLGTSSDGDDNKIWVGNASDKTSDLVYGTGDFTWEAWFNPLDSSNLYKRIIHHGHEWNQNNTIALMWDHTSYNNTLTFWSYALNTSSPILTSSAHTFSGSWNHVAVTRSSGTFRLFVNGTLESTNTSYSASVEGSETSNYATIGATHNFNSNECFKGNISNVRIVKGTAVYTSSFKPPTEPLTNITNTKLLCCNGSSTTSATVTPKTLVADSTVTINTSDSPFDDPDAFTFGDSKEGIIKCGSYVGNGSSTGPEINLGWEPQWLLIKQSDGTGDWTIFDSMRGIVTDGTENYLHPNSSDQETTGLERVDLTSTGFKLTDSGWINYDTKKYIFCALRRPDGYVGKPIEDATKCFAMDTGDDSSTIPNYDSGFPVDFAFKRLVASTNNWQTSARLIQGKYLDLNDTGAEASSSGEQYDSNVGYNTDQSPSTVQAWMFKRHAGMDVVTYKSDGVAGRQLPHSLGRAPEMLWIKDREHTRAWAVYHKGLNGGTNPEDYWLNLDANDAEASNTNIWHSTAPTATHISLGASHPVNTNLIHDMICLAFSSVDGISKVGNYDGSSSTVTVTTGFQPRFVIIKRTDVANDWYVLDTVRGWTSGVDQAIKLNVNHSQFNSHDLGAPTSTGFTVASTNAGWNINGGKYIYYAHA